ncbi:hypothetical protein QUF70_09925 [Desulfobacterales bacterium HSG17]|nr:hypothetical protein [Desulfobacterales bacterium HSG17]
MPSKIQAKKKQSNSSKISETSHGKIPAKLEPLYEAQVAWVLSQFEPDLFSTITMREFNAVWEWLGTCKVRDLITKKKLRDVTGFMLVEKKWPKEALAAIFQIHQAIQPKVDQSGWQVKDFTTPDEILDIMDIFCETEAQRNEWAHRLVSNPVYGLLMSHVLFEGIKRFFADNSLLKMLPGMGLLNRFGGDKFLKAADGIGESLDLYVKPFVEDQIQNLIQTSKSFLAHKLTRDQRESLLKELWPRFQQAEIHALLEPLFDIRTQTAQDQFYRQYELIRKKRIVGEIIAITTDTIYDRFKNRKVNLLLQSFGGTPEWLSDVFIRIITPAIQKAFADGFIESRIREHLGGFYRSDAARVL